MEKRGRGKRLTNSIPSESWQDIESIRSTWAIVLRSSRSFVLPPPLYMSAFQSLLMGTVRSRRYCEGGVLRNGRRLDLPLGTPMLDHSIVLLLSFLG